jgi:hypothetical protein
LFRTHPKHPGKLFPLFVDANEPIEQGKWLAAQAGELTGEKVKSKIGPLAYRPGWHGGDLPIATHIGSKSTSRLKKPDIRPDNHVWAEVEMPNDVDWHSEAQRRGTNAQGRVVPVKAHITDQVPTGGHYRYKTNPNMTGNWLIGGSMKVNRVLPDKEVAAINKAAGVADLPRQQPQDLGKLGFGVVKKAEGGAIDYRGEHAAPGPESGKPMHDTTDVYPADFYGPRGFEYYANTHQPYDRASYDTVVAAKGTPDKMVWAHRAVPKDVYKAAMKTSEPTAHMIRPGDWVTPSREYAKEHGEGLGEGYHIARKRVPAKHLYTNADSIHEWGYHPEPMRKMADGGSVKHMAGGSLRDKILQDAGVYGARRFERALDEIPNLQQMYSANALHSAFTGDNAKAIMTMDPAHFENYAAPIIESLTGHKDPTVIKHLGEKFATPTSEHIKNLAAILRKGGFDDVPFLGLDKEEVGLPLMPFIKGHEGRHRSRALTQTGVTKNLVRLLPRAELREPLPRRSQEEYIAALKAEMDKNGLVRPEPAGMRQERREPVRLPDIYRGGGGVTLPPSIEQMRQALSARRSNSKA